MSSQVKQSEHSPVNSQGMHKKKEGTLSPSLAMLTVPTEALGAILGLSRENEKLEEKQVKQEVLAQNDNASPSKPLEGNEAIFQAAAYATLLGEKARTSTTKQLEAQLAVLSFVEAEKESISKDLQKRLNYIATHNKHDSGWDANLKDFAKDENELSALKKTKINGFNVLFGSQHAREEIKKVMKQVQEILQLKEILEGTNDGKGKDAIFAMEALSMQVEQLGIDNTAKQSERQQEIGKILMDNLSRVEKKLKDALKKLEKAEHAKHHHHGLFGKIKDAIDSIKDVVKDVEKIVKSATSGNFEGAFQGVRKITGQSAIQKALENLAHGNINQGLTTLITAAILTSAFGPMGVALMNTKIGNDAHDWAKLFVDSNEALGLAIAAGFVKLGSKMHMGGESKSDHLLHESKGKAIEMAMNPALQDNPDLEGSIMKFIAKHPMLKRFIEVVEIAGIAGALMTGNIGLALMLGLAYYMTKNNMTQQDLTNKIADEIHNLTGLSKTWSQVIADALVIAMVVAAAVATGGAEAETGEIVDEEAGSLASQEAGSLATNEAGSEGATEESSEETTETKKPEKKGKMERVGEAIGRKGGFGMMGASFALSRSMIGVDLAKAIDKKDKKLALALEITQMIMAAVLAVGGGMGLAASGALSENAEAVMKVAGIVETGVSVYEGAQQMAEGAISVQEGMIIETIATLKANIDQLENVSDRNDAHMKQTTDHLKQLMKQYEQITQANLVTPSLASEGVLRALMQNI